MRMTLWMKSMEEKRKSPKNVLRSTELLYLKYEHNDVVDKASSCTR